MDSFSINCPLHSSEAITRVDVEFGSEKDLYCIECLMASEKPKNLSGRLKSIEDFLQSAANYYEGRRLTISGDKETPEEYQEVVDGQAEKLSNFSQHIEDEKKKVSSRFDAITTAFVKVINQKKDEYLHILDQQLFHFKYGYIFYEKMLRKAFPKADDINLYPTGEELMTKLGKLQNSTQLLAFIKNIKDDINESKLYPKEVQDLGLSADEARRFLLKNLTKRLNEQTKKKPTLIEPDSSLEDIIKQVETSIGGWIDPLFNLSNSIEDIVTGQELGEMMAGGSLIKGNEKALLKSWMDNEFKNKKFKLIYKGSKHGMNATEFHKNCNNQGPTLTVIKSNHGKIFGGFLDQAWTSRNNYVNTTKSWLFSLTNKAKYTQNSGYSSYGAYDYGTYGPTFGGGFDIYLSADFKSNANYCNRHSFNFTDNTSLVGGYNFQADEVEVYALV